MASTLTKGRTNPCKDNIGGIRSLYLFTYVYYDPSNFGGEPGVSLTSFPATTIYRFEGVNANFNEQIISDERGLYFSQDLTFSLKKQSVSDTNIWNDAMGYDLRYVVQYNNGKLRLGGLYNGGRVRSVEIVSGGAKNDFNGYNITISGQERWAAPFMDSLDVLTSGGYIVQDGNNFVFQDGNNYIFQ